MAAADVATHLYVMANAAEGRLKLRDTHPNESGLALQEILFAYVSLADRKLFHLFGPEVRDRAMQELDALLPQAVTESLCHSWPENLKNDHVLKFTANMRNAEAEYGQLKVLWLPREDDLFMKCALNVMEALGKPNPWDEALPFCLVLMKITTEMDMVPHVRKLGEAMRITN